MLETRSLTKRYASVPAVLNVSFRIAPGQILGYLGPNGSGKSTTVKMITGLLAPTEGHIFYGGEDIHKNLAEYKRHVGYVPEEANLYPYLSGHEYLELVGQLRGLNASWLGKRIDEYLRLFSLYASRQVSIATYSKGMRQRILITAALLHNPDVLIFDEPLLGLDVTSGWFPPSGRGTWRGGKIDFLLFARPGSGRKTLLTCDCFAKRRRGGVRVDR